MKALAALSITLALALAACGPAGTGLPLSTPAATHPSATPLTALPATGSAVTPSEATASVGTAEPVVVTSLPAGLTPAPAPTVAPDTPIPTLASGASPTELKYRLLGRFPNLFFCDPDLYPVARGDEGLRAQQAFASLQANAEEFQAILQHNGLSGLAVFTDEQTLLIYREHKKLGAILLEVAGDSYRFQLETADNRDGLVVTGRIDGAGLITVERQDPTIATCPICLAAGTLIDTPNGPAPVQALRPGDALWTVTAAGVRVIGTIVKTAAVPVAAGHPMLHLVLSDGRELWASPGHPTADGRPLDSLKLGDGLDGASVVRAERVAYGQAATYDLLPSGDTGAYWANGILVGSTLAGRPAAPFAQGAQWP